MRIRHDRLVTRILGVCLGLAFLALGVAGVAGGRAWTETIAGDRALGLGLTLIVGGLLAIVGSLTVADPGRIW